MKHRLNIELPPEFESTLIRIQIQTDAASRTEVIRRALDVYEALHHWASDGWELELRKEGRRKSFCRLENNQLIPP